jgi:hypothetical protein
MGPSWQALILLVMCLIIPILAANYWKQDTMQANQVKITPIANRDMELMGEMAAAWLPNLMMQKTLSVNCIKLALSDSVIEQS